MKRNGTKKSKEVKRGDNMSLQVVPGKNELSMRQGVPSEHEMMVFHTMAEQAVSSKMYKGIGEKSGVMMIMLAARELGIPPMSALNGGLNIIQGKVEISARMMNALIRKSGHHIVTKELTDSHCILMGKRCDTGETQETSFSLVDAQKAGLVKQGGGWTKFPKDMCYARALSRLARQLFSDVIGIGYIEGEISQADIKPSFSEIVELPKEEQVEIENEQEYIDKFLGQFDQDNKMYAVEYLKVVMKHFEWTAIQAIKELMKDPEKLNEKFQKWLSKKVKDEKSNTDWGNPVVA